MGKRRQTRDSDEESEHDDEQVTNDGSEESEEEKPIKKSRSKLAEKGKGKAKNESEAPPRTAKKPRMDSDNDGDTSTSQVKTDTDGRKYLELGNKKRATLSEFKGTVFLDIREFYGQEGDEKPGKKGISITQEQWNILKSNSGTIDYLFTKAKKK
ncbi:transcriptional Coactivator p15-domain-containing protein [Cristinia sonorae]|uniref:Transcriptional Coactivator p15-domain-containing protein n=1 Tax=Cristinia sonorae TaxID=1940300 RepID=A0A8K0XUN2_9AGAR|nr:transcriptional Coactivator p15-domain-containing protein [Cristinia sonorae]